MTRLEDLDQFTESDVEKAVQRNDTEELRLVSITLALVSPDPFFTESVCAGLASHSDGTVRAHALVSLGHLARRFRRLNKAIVAPLIERGFADPDDYVRSNAKSAADEIHQFLHWEFTGHRYGAGI